MSGQIFISYRRKESRWSAGRLYDRLVAPFDRQQIFMDIDGIALGEDFVEAIETKVAKCDLLIAVIGPDWLNLKDDEGRRRLDNPRDFVRMEIGAALKRKIRVIPVLVDGAVMPRETELPDDLTALARRNALRISDTSFDGDCQRLVAAIKLVLGKTAAEEQEREKDRLRRERDERQGGEPESSETDPGSSQSKMPGSKPTDTQRRAHVTTPKIRLTYLYWSLCVGFLTALTSRLIMHVHLGFIPLFLLATCGSFVGQLIARYIFRSKVGAGFDVLRAVSAIIGALIIVYLVCMLA